MQDKKIEEQDAKKLALLGVLFEELKNLSLIIFVWIKERDSKAFPLLEEFNKKLDEISSVLKS